MSDTSRYPRGFCGVSNLLFKVALFFLAKESNAFAAVKRVRDKRAAN